MNHAADEPHCGDTIHMPVLQHCLCLKPGPPHKQLSVALVVACIGLVMQRQGRKLTLVVACPVSFARGRVKLAAML